MSDNELFKKFVTSMNDVLQENSGDGRDQKSLLEDLFKYEIKFRDTLISTKEGKQAYKDFVYFIVNDKGNILSSRVYFRERQDAFSEGISPAFRKNKHHLLYRFHINYMFAKWVIDRYKGPKVKSLTNSYIKIVEIRKLLCENNLPLAINRAKIFWSKVPSTHLDYMDIIQTACEGLINAIDKFVPPYASVFKSVVIGRMTLNVLTDHNSTLIRFSPTERRILYRANNARVKAGLETPDGVLAYVKESFKGATLNQISNIANAAGELISINDPVKQKAGADRSERVTIKDFIADEKISHEEALIHVDLRRRISETLSELPVLERKVISLKSGIPYE